MQQQQNVQKACAKPTNLHSFKKIELTASATSATFSMSDMAVSFHMGDIICVLCSLVI